MRFNTIAAAELTAAGKWRRRTSTMRKRQGWQAEGLVSVMPDQLWETQHYAGWPKESISRPLRESEPRKRIYRGVGQSIKTFRVHWVDQRTWSVTRNKQRYDVERISLLSDETQFCKNNLLGLSKELVDESHDLRYWPDPSLAERDLSFYRRVLQKLQLSYAAACQRIA